MKVTTKNLTKRYGEKIALNKVNLEIPDSSFLVILGPSGSGKTTLLRLIAGLLYPSEGKIFFGEDNITQKPANKRNIAMVFQNYPLFPHMTVRENLRFPLESQREGQIFKKRIYSDEEIKAKVEETLKLLHIEEHTNKYPSQLSGGEKQRVAIGRELIREPVLFLFDEPLSNIDARLRYEMRTWIRTLHGMINRTMIYVTHDQSEAMALGDIIVLLNEGEIVQIGSPDELYNNPKNRFVAEFIGNFPMNFLSFHKKDKNLILNNDKKIELPNSVEEIVSRNSLEEGEIGFRAELVRELDSERPIEENMLILECIIEDVEKVLDQQILTLNFNEERIVFVTKTIKEFERKSTIQIIVYAESIYVFDRAGLRTI
ncbi:MAG: ABC transporter ATP-binding protein [Candidatus Heimdallarchaeota archaeon]|nr:ABC transporter ATP-binding protein [Candidatus Heimdallarchaeota archaeon]